MWYVLCILFVIIFDNEGWESCLFMIRIKMNEDFVDEDNYMCNDMIL